MTPIVERIFRNNPLRNLAGRLTRYKESPLRINSWETASSREAFNLFELLSNNPIYTPQIGENANRLSFPDIVPSISVEKAIGLKEKLDELTAKWQEEGISEDQIVIELMKQKHDFKVTPAEASLGFLQFREEIDCIANGGVENGKYSDLHHQFFTRIMKCGEDKKKGELRLEPTFAVLNALNYPTIPIQ